MKKSIHNICSGIVSLFLILLTGCKIEGDSPQKTPNLTKPEVTLKLSEDDPKTSVVISWTAVEDANTYAIRRMNERDGVQDIQIIASINADKPLTYVDDSCENDTEYFYVVQVEAYGESYYSMNLLFEGAHKYIEPFTGEPFSSSSYYEYSEIKSIKTQADPDITLDYPKNVTVKLAENMNNALTVSWDPVAGAKEYEVYYLTSVYKYINEEFKLQTVTKETSFTKEELYNDHSYYFRVRAVNGEKCSIYSAKIEGKVPEADNISMDKALEIEIGKKQYIYSNSDTLWFKCAPKTGRIKYVTESYDFSSLSIFSEDGKVLASGLPLNIVYGIEDNSISKTTDGIIRKFCDDIEVFMDGETYIFRITKPDNRDYLHFIIY